MKRYILKQGDKSSVGGVAIDGIPNYTHDGTPITYVGARVLCPACNSEGRIVGIGPRQPNNVDGKEEALHGDLCACKCHPSPVMVNSQTDSCHSFEGGSLAGMGYDAYGQSIRNEPERDYDECVRILDERGRPMSRVPYHIRVANGRVYKGVTDSSGYCPRFYSENPSHFGVAVGIKALELWNE